MLNRYKFKARLIILLLFLLLFSSLSYAAGSQEGKVEIYYEKVEAGQYKFYARNLNYAPYQIKLSFQQLRNMKVDTQLPYYGVIDARETKQYLFTVTAEEGSKYSFNYKYQYLLGDPNAVRPDDKAYLFPYQHGNKHKLTQGYNGGYSHRNTLALDFEMKRGTPITAARSGVVVRVKENSNIGGPSRRYIKHANYITIYHEDGTFADYAHLKYNGARAEVGDKVRAGEVIAYSGNTGWSRGPHLHFEIFKPIRMNHKTIATDFLNHNSQRVRARAGNYYYAYQPGMNDFKVQLGRKLSNQDYAGYSTPINQTNQLELKRERIDDTIILFIKNGYDKEVEVEVDFKQAQNIETSKSIPYSKIVPATTEVYAFLFRPANHQQQWGYSLQYSYRK
ncbi:M23 family metallopeptidase [Halanaerobacter jeridensis]|uniref:Murein DD-endopeptidase MepM/ murein hydrolase activator NlpD n=1 Tax=Halanaerobacter jeridensis TaxID=706427 RepID=A0A939BRC8_9FIRM|nr:M23 family metallopeptidase [Halanaerobacter jeridensis]MBM7555861.1 murein DD-endopeptidase MepM/ murein hydrolase activator NlpD [Halanaerobacter jeridensis]